MNPKLRTIYKDKFRIRPITLIGFLAYYTFHSYLVLYFIIPVIDNTQLQEITNGVLTGTLIAYVFSLFFFMAIFKAIGIKSKSLIKTENANSSIIIGTIMFAALMLLQLPFISYEKIAERGFGNMTGGLIQFISSAFFEELIFRSFLLTSLIYIFDKQKSRTKSIWLAVIISSVIFSAAHIPYYYMIDYMDISYFISLILFGIMLSWIYIWFGNIFLVSAIHLLYFISMTYLPFDGSGKGLTILLWLLLTTLLSIYGYRLNRKIYSAIKSIKSQHT